MKKETRMRETMKMMGLSQWVLWTTWYIKQLIFFFPVVAMTLLLKVKQKRQNVQERERKREEEKEREREREREKMRGRD